MENQPVKQIIQEQSKDKLASWFLFLFGASFLAGLYFTNKNKEKQSNYQSEENSSSSQQTLKIKKSVSNLKRFKDSEDENENPESNQNNKQTKSQKKLTQKFVSKSKKLKKKQKKGDNSYSDEEETENEFQDEKLSIEKDLITVEELFLNLLSETKKQQRKKIKVALTTDNKEKIQAAKIVLQSLYPKFQDKIKLVAYKCNSYITHGQPWGTQHTYEGASARLQDLRDKIKRLRLDPITEYDFLISIENGVFSILEHEGAQGQDIACVIVEKKTIQPKQEGDNNNQKTQQQQVTWERKYGFSMARPYPLSTVFQAKQNGATGKEIGELIRNYYDERPMILSRFEQMETCIESVFKMFISNSNNNNNTNVSDNNISSNKSHKKITLVEQNGKN